MITIPQLENYSTMLKDAVPAIKRVELAVNKEDLAVLMKEHDSDDNILLLAVLPEHGMEGNQDNAQFMNICGWFVLEKTDYGDSREEYLAIFDRTQAAAKAIIEKMIIDKAENSGLFCGFLSGLHESSLSASPIKMLSGCNGYYIQVNITTRP